MGSSSSGAAHRDLRSLLLDRSEEDADQVDANLLLRRDRKGYAHDSKPPPSNFSTVKTSHERFSSSRAAVCSLTWKKMHMHARPITPTAKTVPRMMSTSGSSPMKAMMLVPLEHAPPPDGTGAAERQLCDPMDGT